MTNIEILKFKLKQTLQFNSQKRRKLATTWRIEPSRLAHYKTSNLIYTQPIPNTGKEYSCVFLLDISWSMYNSKELEKAVEGLKKLINLFYWIIDFEVIAFGKNIEQFSARQVLSLPKDNQEIYDKINKKIVIRDFWTYTTYIDLCDKGKFTWDENTDSTFITPALKLAGDLLNKRGWDKFIVLLTDWEEYYPDCVTQITWIDVTKYNKDTHWDTKKEIEKDWIEILPISIGRDYLPDFYTNKITLKNSTDWLEEKVIEFIDKNFWKQIEF